MRPVTRIPPLGPPQAYKTYEIDAPEQTHFRDATCTEVDCAMQASGWVTAVDEATALGQQQARYIRRVSDRAYMEEHENGQTMFRFPAGEECFSQHRIRLERPEYFIVRGGDFRGNPRGDVRVHDSADDWVEDFAEHQDRLSTALNG